MTDQPPDLDEEPDIEPDTFMLRTGERPREYIPHEATSLTHDYVAQHDPYAPVLNTVEDPYEELGGLARPDAYFGAIEFDCPEPPLGCGAQGKTADRDGEKCRIWVERTGLWHKRRMPCLIRLRLAREAGVL